MASGRIVRFDHVARVDEAPANAARERPFTLVEPDQIGDVAVGFGGGDGRRRLDAGRWDPVELFLADPFAQ